MYFNILKIRILILIFLFFGLSDIKGQIKYEKEYRLKPNEVPLEIRGFIDSCDFTSKIKWFAEESEHGKSFEAKVTPDRSEYSIEFDTWGNLEDVELEVEWDKLTPQVRDFVSQHFEKAFLKHKIIKIQLQWTGQRSELLQIVKSRRRSDVINYEIVVKGKNTDKTHWYEYLFDSQGTILRTSEIVFRNTDNLDY